MTGAIDETLKEVRREHRAFRAVVHDLQRLAASPASAAHQQLQQALHRFLDTWGPRLSAHLDLEERLVTPSVIHALPIETWTFDTFGRERETFDALLDLLREGSTWLDQDEPGAEREIAAALDDLSLLWTRHVRRVDVIRPLLSGHEGAGHA